MIYDWNMQKEPQPNGEEMGKIEDIENLPLTNENIVEFLKRNDTRLLDKLGELNREEILSLPEEQAQEKRLEHSLRDIEIFEAAQKLEGLIGSLAESLRYLINEKQVPDYALENQLIEKLHAANKRKIDTFGRDWDIVSQVAEANATAGLYEDALDMYEEAAEKLQKSTDVDSQKLSEIQHQIAYLKKVLSK
jgi:hypothetical protein